MTVPPQLAQTNANTEHYTSITYMNSTCPRRNHQAECVAHGPTTLTHAAQTQPQLLLDGPPETMGKRRRYVGTGCLAGVNLIWLVAGLVGWLATSTVSGQLNDVPVPAPPGLVAWWSGDGDALDRAGANHGTLMNGVTFAPGKVGQAFSFDRDGQSVRIPASPQLDVGVSGAITIEAWMWPTDVAIWRPLIAWDPLVDGKYGAHVGIGETVWNGPRALFANLCDTADLYWYNHFVTSPAEVVAANVWAHVALTYDKINGVARFYHNGMCVADVQVGSFSFVTSTAFRIGYNPYANDPNHTSFAGAIDEVCLYNRALTAEEILSIYQAGSAGKVRSAVVYCAETVHSVRENELSVSANVTLCRSANDPNLEVSVDYTTIDDTALAGQDYIPTSGTLTFAAGETNKQITIQLLNDTTREPEEQFHLVLSDPTGGVWLGNSNVVVRIHDDDFPFSADFETGVGPEWSTTKTDGTPVENRRFLGQFGNETVSLTLSNLPPHHEMTVSFDLFIINTWDGNWDTYGPDVWDVGVQNGPTLLHTTFARYPDAPSQAFPDWYPGGQHPWGTGATEIDALGYGMDCVYHLSFTFPHTNNEVTFEFSGQGLQDIGDESWGLDNVSVEILALPPNGTVYCRQRTQVVGENESSVGVNLALYRGTNDPSLEVSVDYVTANDTAHAGQDYTAVSGTLTFAAGETNQQIVIQLLNDTIREAKEDFHLLLSNPTRGVSLGTSNILIRIQDEDPSILHVWQESPSPAPPYTTWETAAHTIQDAVDEALPSETIVVTNGVYETGGTVNRVALGSPVVLRSVNGSEVTIIRGQEGMRCAYVGAEAVLSGFTLTNGYAVQGGGVWCEASGVVTNCVLTGNSASDSGGGAWGGTLWNCTLSRNLAQSNGGGAAQSTLYNSVVSRNTAGWGGGGTWGGTLHNCTIASNSLFDFDPFAGGGGACEGTLYNCVLTGNSACCGGGASGATLYNCTIVGNSVTSTEAGSCGGGVYWSTLYNCIAYYNTAGDGPNYYGECSFEYSCTTPLPDGPGNIDSDPLLLSLTGGDVRLSPGSPCIDAGTNLSALITTDLFGNPRPWDGDGDGTAAFDMGAHEFQSDAGGYVSFLADTYSVVENEGQATIQLVRLGLESPDTSITVEYAVSGGTGTAGLDFTPVSGTVTFAAGETNHSFLVPILNDAFREAEETIFLILRNPPAEVPLFQAMSTVRIQDNDVGIGFVTNDIAVLENQPSVTLTVRCGPDFGAAFSVDYAVSGWSATADTDYVAVSGTLEFGLGETNKEIVVPLLNDALREAEETILLTLRNPFGGVSLDLPTTATIRILDNDVGIGFVTNDIAVLENQPSVTLTVQYGPDFGIPFSVDYAVSGGTATADTDYVAVSGTLEFGLGETNKEIVVPLLNDALREAEETILLTLRNPIGGVSLDLPTTATIRILDNDVGIRFATSDIAVLENQPSVTLTVRCGPDFGRRSRWTMRSAAGPPRRRGLHGGLGHAGVWAWRDGKRNRGSAGSMMRSGRGKKRFS